MTAVAHPATGQNGSPVATSVSKSVSISDLSVVRLDSASGERVAGGVFTAQAGGVPGGKRVQSAPSATAFRCDFTALQVFLEKAAELRNASPDFERAFGVARLDGALVEHDPKASGPTTTVLVVRPAPAWIETFRKHGGVWP